MTNPQSVSGNASFGIVSWLRSGNLIVDMVVAMLIPLACRWIFEGAGRQALTNFVQRVLDLMYRSGAKECVRTISHITSSRHHSGTLDQRNELLQKALTLYLTQVVDVKFKHKAQVALTALHDVKFGHMNGQFDRYNPLEHYRLTWLAPDGEWVEVDGENNIEFRQYTQSMPNQGDTSNGGEKNKEQIIHELRCTRGTGAHKRIDDFIGKAVAWYKAELQKQRDESRYLYVMNLTERYSISSTEKEDEPCKYKRYKLSDHKTFGSLFFPQKDALLSVLTDFEQRRGRFGKEGFPHKLGLMLHGPPGTGKTSLIKALAHHTGRSIVSIPLAQIKTNQQLMDTMYDLKLKIDGCDSPPVLQFKDVIFVIEDVDAASKIVLRRDSPDTAASRGDMPVAPEQLRALASSLAKPRVAPPEAGVGDDAPCAAEGPKPPTMMDMVESYLKPRPDELNLAGLLNVLDGVVDTPGRLLILTSNHPEKLDPALIRPGRIDQLIHLGHMLPEAASQMITHYLDCGELDERQRARLDAVLAPVPGGAAGVAAQVTPATLEMLCARHGTIDELLDALSTHVAEPLAPHTTYQPKPTKTVAECGISPPTGAALVKPEAGGCPDEPLPIEVKRQVSGG